MTHIVETAFSGGMAFVANVNEHPVLMDTSPEEGGMNSGPSPKRLMLASIAGCTGMDVVMILKKQRVNFSEFNIHVEANVTDKDPKFYDEVKLVYKIKVDQKDEAKVKKAVALSQEKYCGVSAMFRAFAKLETEIIFL